MSLNPYAPPTAFVDSPAATENAGDAPLYFAVSPLKLVVMSTCTFGLYEVYWFYMNWRIVQRRARPDIWPVPRAIFGLFFCHALFAAIRRDGEARAVDRIPQMGALALGWIVLSMTWKLPEPFDLVSLLTVVPLVPVQVYVNRLNARCAPRHDPNRRFSVLNWAGVVLGGLLVVASILGSFVPAAAR
jgi:hypothetical protein